MLSVFCVAKKDTTIVTSQIKVYLGFGGLLLKMPAINLETNGWLPTDRPSIGS